MICSQIFLVFYSWFPRTFHVLPTYFPRTFHILSMYFSRTFHVLFTYFPRTFHVLSTDLPHMFTPIFILFLTKILYISLYNIIVYYTVYCVVQCELLYILHCIVYIVHCTMYTAYSVYIVVCVIDRETISRNYHRWYLGQILSTPLSSVHCTLYSV